MSAPYWGQLPPPKSSGQTRARRLSDDQDPPPDRRQSLDAPVQGQQRSNRISVQTTKSDAPTDSTLSPFVSPTASSFQDQGLSPRPPSLPYGANQYPPELIENRRRRRSRNQEQENEYAAVTTGPPPPTAPDVPRAPLSSTKYPPATGGQPHPYPAPPQGIGRPSRKMAAEEYYKGADQAQKEARATLDESAMPRPQRVGTDPTLGRSSPLPNGRRRASAAEQSLQRSARRTSANNSADRAKTLADVRSPLQRLELTLDSISKEDKRARVEAAERAARERAAGKGATPGTAPGTAQQGPKSPQQVRFRERRPSVAAGDAPTAPITPITPITPTRPVQHSAGQNGPLTQNPPDEGRRQSAAAEPSPSAAPESRIPAPVQSSGIPQRNLSFRERAAKNDMPPPSLESPASKEATPSGPHGRTPPRSGGNKLKKNPPDWPNRISESSEIFNTGEVAARSPQVVGGPVPAPSAAGPPVQLQQQQPQHQQHQQHHFESAAEPPSRAPQFRAPQPREAEYLHDDFAEEFMAHPPSGKLQKSPSQRKANQILGRTPTQAAADTPQQAVVSRAMTAPMPTGNPPAYEAAAPHFGAHNEEQGPGQRHRVSDFLYGRDRYQPGQGIFKPTPYLDEWKKATVGALAGGLLDLENVPPAVEKNAVDKNAPWWEQSQSQSRRRSDSMSNRPIKAEAFEGEYDETSNAPTRFKPPLYLKCGPLLRYCGIRHERVPSRSTRNGAVVDREVWRGSIMIVTTDADSSYDIAPTLRLFAQPIELLPPPPREIHGDEPLAPEYVDPIAGHPKLGRKGETLYVRPVDHLEEAKDVSRNETDDGLFEKTRSPPEAPLPPGVTDLPGSFAARRKRAEMDGEKAGKYKDVRGFRLHAERGYTFWRFNIEVELREKQQRVAYRINRGPSTGFWVPAKGQSMNIMFHSCNGFSMSVDPNELSGPDPMWRDVLNSHQSQPFHVMIGGGDQIYNDKCMQDTTIFKDWLMIKNPLHKHNAPFTPEMQDELETFYLERYAMWFSQGLFGMANSQIPMVNMYDDHDIIDGFGSYPHHFMNSPVFSGLGNVAFKYYMLFQHQSIVAETEKTEPSWVLGAQPGPYINEQSRSMFMFLGGKIALLAVDARTERSRQEVIREDTWKKIMDRCYGEIDKGKVEHLLVLMGVPVAYPRLVWLENILTSRVMDPVKALAKLGMFGGLLNRFDGGVEVLDDLDDHWTAKNHKQERSIVIEDLQDLAADKSIRVTMLSGDVHLAGIGQFYSNPKLGLAKHKDFRYMPNVISSAIVNTPPPDLLADVLNKRNKVHHFDKETDEDMIPIFGHGVDGKPRNNKHLLPHRNWCAIREYAPGNTPLPTPGQSAYDLTPLGSPPGTAGGERKSLFRRLSRSKTTGPDGGPKDRTRPPLSGGGLLRSFSRRAGAASADEVGKPQPRPGFLTRSLSSSSVSGRIGGLFRRRSSTGGSRRDDGGINGTWGPDTDEEEQYQQQYGQHEHTRGGVGMRGGLGPDHQGGYNSEYAQDDESYFSVKPGHAPAGSDVGPPVPPKPIMHMTGGSGSGSGQTVTFPPHQHHQQQPHHLAHHQKAQGGEDFVPKPFHRTPTTLSAKQRKTNPAEYAVDLTGALEVTLNAEISPRDPGGSTVPYRLVVPRLWYEYEGDEGQGHGQGQRHRDGRSSESSESEGEGVRGAQGMKWGQGAQGAQGGQGAQGAQGAQGMQGGFNQGGGGGQGYGYGYGEGGAEGFHRDGGMEKRGLETGEVRGGDAGGQLEREEAAMGEKKGGIKRLLSLRRRG